MFQRSVFFLAAVWMLGCKKNNERMPASPTYAGQYQVMEHSYEQDWQSGSPVSTDHRTTFNGKVIESNDGDTLYFIGLRPAPYPEWFDDNMDTLSVKIFSTDSLALPGTSVTGKIKPNDTLYLEYFYGAPWINKDFTVKQHWVKMR